MIDFGSLSEEEFDRYAAHGIVGPYSNDFSAIGAVLECAKPIAWVRGEVASVAVARYKWLRMSAIPHLWHLPEKALRHAVYCKDEAFERLCRALDTYPYWGQVYEGWHTYRDINTVTFDVEVGRALGYRDVDIAAFLSRNYGYRTVVEHYRLRGQMAGVIAGVGPQVRHRPGDTQVYAPVPVGAAENSLGEVCCAED